MKMLKYRTLSAIFILTVITAAAYTQVNQDELQQGLPPVVFINYEGPHAVLNTREQIRQIGVGLGRGTPSSTTGALNRYFIIRSTSGPEGNKISADIFGLGADAAVDHIRNLRVIIQGFLQTAHNYNERDAALLAQYITIYNAVYRGNWNYFTNRYVNQVINNLARERTGLSIRYDEWPGRTMVLIPLGIGGLSSVDTTTITDRQVLEELRKEDDKGIQQRQDMVAFKEREADQAEQLAQTERQAIRQEERAIERERRETDQERQGIQEDRQRTREDQQAGRITQSEAEKAQEDLGKKEQELEEKEQDLDKRESDLQQRREDAQKLEDFAEKKSEEAQQDRQEIAKDQQAGIAQETSGSSVYGVMIENSDTGMGRIIRISTSGQEQRRSPLNSIHTRTVTILGGKILAVAGENKGNGAVRLVEINNNSLEIAKQGDNDIRPGSLLWVNGSDIYAITTEESSCYLGRFNTNLLLQAKSVVKIHPNASVTIQQGRLLTQGENGSVLLLNPADLTEAK
ncbi:MAG: hypothetical protein LBH16_03515 [Treponema sp.]|jgi:hypothetical protein|nr:hypothetical protein [Treponema sp.]